MHTNIVRLRYRSAKDVEQAVEKLKGLAANLPALSGFKDFSLVRTAEDETIHVVRFATEADAAAARERMLPRLREIATPHLATDPEVRHGDELFTK